MLRWLLLLVVFYTPGIVSNSSKQLPKNYQAEFAWKFYKQISQSFETNIVSSPYHIREAFACLSNVSLPSNTLSKEFQKAILLPRTNLIHTRYDLQRERFQCRDELRVATLAAGLGTKHVLDGKFRSTMDHCRMFQTRVATDHAIKMTQKLNEVFWNASNNEMRMFLSPTDIDVDWDFLIMNSVVLSAQWKYQFKPSDTTVCPFYASKSKQIYTEFMQVEGYFRYGYFSQWNLAAVEVPFQDGSPYSCLLMHSIDGSLSNMMKNYDHNRFREIYQKLNEGKTTIIMPKSIIRVSLKSSNILKSLGLKTPFTEKIWKVFNSPNGVSLGEFMQKVTIQFESGVGQIVKNIPGRDLGNQFIAHEPFVFTVFDRQELTPIIVGHLIEPTKTEKPKSNHLMCQNPPRWTFKG
ncbi:serpin B5 [Culex pipiens pallens]|uniref:serpin B5 n=1 Tax=Culex pipiens pallens TaxID=42434 RepID=UPI0019545AC4|nr:serpin B5 [Culex pipiens pallens]